MAFPELTTTRDRGRWADEGFGSRSMDPYYERLMDELVRVSGADAVQLAVATFTIERSLERIGDHATIMGARLLYLLTGNPDHVVGEVR